MSEFDHIQNIWNAQKTKVAISSEDALQKVVSVHKSLQRKHLKQSIMLYLTVIAIIVIDIISSEKIETSSTGLVILVICALFFGTIRLWLFQRIRNIDFTTDSLNLLSQVNRYKKDYTLIMKEGQMIYLLVLSLGVYFYVKPVLPLYSEGIIAFILITYLLWVGFYFLVLRKKELNAEVKHLDKIISQLKDHTK